MAIQGTIPVEFGSVFPHGAYAAGSFEPPFVPVEFAGLTITPYAHQAGRLAYSFKATGARAPRPGRPGAEPKDNAA
jgi:hypothetical protein